MAFKKCIVLLALRAHQLKKNGLDSQTALVFSGVSCGMASSGNRVVCESGSVVSDPPLAWKTSSCNSSSNQVKDGSSGGSWIESAAIVVGPCESPYI